MDFKEFDLIVINSSGGKDSLAALWEVCRIAKEQNYPFSQMVVSHQDLGISEWEGTKELVHQQAAIWGLDVHVSKRRNKDGYEETLLEYVERRGMWPSSGQRYCTSDFKRDPGGRVVRGLTKGMDNCRVLHVLGFRAEESPARAKRPVVSVNKRLSTKTREVIDWLPIHDWSTKKVWEVIHGEGLPYHSAMTQGCHACLACSASSAHSTPW